jgi:hypothetical protein
MHSARVREIEAQVDAAEGVAPDPLDLDWEDILRRVGGGEDD